MEDGITCMAFTVSFVPNTGNRYFMAATDEHVRLYDFEAAQVLIITKVLHVSRYFLLYFLKKRRFYFKACANIFWKYVFSIL